MHLQNLNYPLNKDIMLLKIIHQFNRTWYSTEDRTDEESRINRRKEEKTDGTEKQTGNRETEEQTEDKGTETTEGIDEEEPHVEESKICNATEFKELRYEVFDLQKYGFQYNNMEQWTNLR
jgi:hypothetical protein